MPAPDCYSGARIAPPTPFAGPTFRLTFINAKVERITRYIPAEKLNGAIDSAFDDDGAQFLTIKKVSPDACPDHA